MTRLTATALSPSAYQDNFAREHLPPPGQWPDFHFDLPELAYPARLNCVAELLDASYRSVATKKLIARLDAGEGPDELT